MNDHTYVLDSALQRRVRHWKQRKFLEIRLPETDTLVNYIAFAPSLKAELLRH